MKSGTSTLHQMLADLPGVFIPDPEIYLFSIDDIEQHPEFFQDRGKSWVMRDFDAKRDEYLAWYARFFADAPPGATIGEDSTSYLHSTRCAERIREVLPNARLIFVLRDPARRTYSHYWHLVRTGRAVEDFERTLRHSPGTLFQRSRYAEQARRYIELFPADQLKFVLFEDLIDDPGVVLRELVSFLGLPQPPRLASVPHRNPTRVPRSMTAQLWRNRLFRDRVANRFRGHLPGSRRATGSLEQAVSGRWARWNLRTDRTPPPMRASTHRFLNVLFRHENDGLSELIGIDVERHWYRNPKDT